MNSNSAQKPHIVCVPFPAQGHVIPMMQLAKLLHSRGFFITFVNSEHNQRRLIRSQGPERVAGFADFRFETIPEGLPRIEPTKSHSPVAVFESIPKTCLGPFRDLLIKLKSTAEIPPITCIVADGLMGFTIKAGNEFGIPVMHFWTASACGFMGYFQYPELIKRGIFPFKDFFILQRNLKTDSEESDASGSIIRGWKLMVDEWVIETAIIADQSFKSDGSLDAKVDWIPGMRNMRLKDIPSFIQTTDPNDISFNFLREEIQNCLKASALIFNTFDAFEHEVLQAISSMFPRIYTIGPLPLLSKGIPESQLQSFRPSFWIEDTKCLEWLDKREPNSVVYVNYGSITKMTDHHLKEFAWGLANSKHPFLWIVRDNIIMGDSAILSEDFLEETKDRCLLTSWCQQDHVLSHSSIGVFLTHCGWNSTLETICAGVPIICWPFFSEQQTNCRYSCTDQWGIGVEVNNDVKRDEIEALVKEMMEGDKGKQLKKKALEWKKMAEEATSVEGSSYTNFDRLVKEALHPTND